MKERLQKILSARGAASRRQAEAMMAAGRVTVNGVVARVGDSADPEVDEIHLDGKVLAAPPSHVYLMLNKPRGFLTTVTDDRGRKTTAELVADCGERVYPVGRLDRDSEGLLLFTNDGEFANFLMHPRHEVEKIYQVWVQGHNPASEMLLSRPITLDGRPIRRPKVKLLSAEGNRAWYQVTIHEGRNRQVRRMCQAAGLTVMRLRRVAEGPVKLGNLETGKWRPLTSGEVEALRK